MLSQRLLALGYSNEELQCWHLSVGLTSHPVHATVDLLRCRLPCHLKNQGAYIRTSVSLCVCTEAKTLFKSLRENECKGILNKQVDSPEITVSRRVSSRHEEQAPPQHGILVEGCRSFLSGWALQVIFVLFRNGWTMCLLPSAYPVLFSGWALLTKKCRYLWKQLSITLHWTDSPNLISFIVSAVSGLPQQAQTTIRDFVTAVFTLLIKCNSMYLTTYILNLEFVVNKSHQRSISNMDRM